MEYTLGDVLAFLAFLVISMHGVLFALGFIAGNQR